MGGWCTSATTMHVGAKQLLDVNTSAANTTEQIIGEYYGGNAALASRLISRYEERARFWQYANGNLNSNLHQRVVPDEPYSPALREFNDRLVEELDACIGGPTINGVSICCAARSSSFPCSEGSWPSILHGGAALENSVTVRASVRKLEAALVRARERGYRRGLCWDVDSPAAGEGIGRVKYRW